MTCRKIISFILCAGLLFAGAVKAEEQAIYSDFISPDPSIILIEPTPTPEPRSVRIFIDRRPVMTVNDPVTLTSKLSGFTQDDEIYYQWQCDKGNGFEDVAGATSSSYVFPATKETLSWSWRLKVSFAI